MKDQDFVSEAWGAAVLSFIKGTWGGMCSPLSRHFKGVVSMGTIRSLSDVQPSERKWNWNGYFPLGEIAILEGDGGLGKSTLIADIARRLSMGENMPDGSPSRIGSTLLISNEEDETTTVRPRFNAINADIDRIKFSSDLAFPEDLDKIVDCVRESQVSLVVVDPWSAHVETSTSGEQAMRKVLGKIRKIASENDFGVLLVRHLNKASSSSGAIHAGLGSVGIGSFGRAVFRVFPDPDVSNDRILAATKFNLGEKPAPLRFRLKKVNGFGAIEWLGPSQYTIEDLLKPRRKIRPKLDPAKELLRKLLQTGPRFQSDIIAMGEACGISESTIDRAKREMDIKWNHDGFGGPVLWRLSDPTVDENDITDVA